MTDVSQSFEFNVLGCRIKYNPTEEDKLIAKSVVDLVSREVEEIKKARPTLKDTDVAVLVALKFASEKLQMEKDFKETVIEIESTIGKILS